ncbi:MAG: lysophospholipid acyltransferase family protein [Phycisphaerales bacterium]
MSEAARAVAPRAAPEALDPPRAPLAAPASPSPPNSASSPEGSSRTVAAAELAAVARPSAGQRWVAVLLLISGRAPWLIDALRPLSVFFAWHTSSRLRDATTANAARILGPASTPAQRRALGKGVVGSFVDFLTEMARSQRQSAEQLLARLDSVQGRERYFEARKARRGAILVTAHMGSFETAVAEIRRFEPKVRVVFQRDQRISRFEDLRAGQRKALGTIESPVGEGDDPWMMWFALRDALLADEIVLMQGDRVMPGQRGVRVPFLHGTMMLPPGPIKLAMATGSPVIPVFALRTSTGRVRIVMDEPFFVPPEPPEGWVRGTPHPATLRLARTIAEQISRYPEQWLVVHRAWCEDQPVERA